MAGTAGPRPWRAGKEGGQSSSHGQVLVTWVRRLESPEAASAGPALAWDVLTRAPEEPGARRGSKSKALRAERGSSGPWGPATLQLHPVPARTPPQPHLQPYTITLTPTPIPHTQRAAKALDPHPNPGMSLDWYPAGGAAKGGGSSALLLIGCLTGIYPIAVYIHWF